MFSCGSSSSALRRSAARSGARRAGLLRQGPPEVVVDLLAVLDPLALAPLLGGEVRPLLARVAVDALAHQRVGGVEHLLHRLVAVALLAAA